MNTLPTATWWNRIKLCMKIMFKAAMELNDFHLVMDMLPADSAPVARLDHETSKWQTVSVKFKLFKGKQGRKRKNSRGAAW